MTSRHKAREMALQILFQLEFLPQLDLTQAVDLYRQNLLTSEEEFEYCTELVFGIRDQKSQIDALIESASQNWKIARMALVDVNILRLATFEIRLSKTPIAPKIVIDEAVELAKRYGSTESSSFVNGILDRLAQEELARS